MSNIYGNPWTGLQVTVIGGEVALWTQVWPEFEAIWPNNPLETVASPGTATPTTLISKISRFIGWAMFNATPSTRTEWQAGPLQSNSKWDLNTTLGTTMAGEDIPNDVTKVEFRNNLTYISTATTTVVKTGAGLLHAVIFQWTSIGTVIGYDNTSASGTILFSFPIGVTTRPITFNGSFSIGLTVVTSAADKVTISAR